MFQFEDLPSELSSHPRHYIIHQLYTSLVKRLSDLYYCDVLAESRNILKRNVVHC
jgi:hypothetical protein